MRPNANQRGYTYRWAKRRKAFLKKNPRCAKCGGPATEAHHQPDRKDLVALGVPDPDAERFLVPLCKPHHSEVTASRRRGNPRMRKQERHPGLSG